MIKKYLIPLLLALPIVANAVQVPAGDQLTDSSIVAPCSM